ncbi:putative bifunctional diguanylate cyclase/phosphodiesterase [Kineococcus gynurae]|uniref:Bifunctional diguanylate cyclase/phosphodiesterase n=1 Tax=Kineococcus gynurae TaxID=452979 RepID=A0ABV5LWM2_9ACTN
MNLQLVELLTLLSKQPDATAMATRAARWAAEALDAETAAVVRAGVVLAGVGVRTGANPLVGEVLAAAGRPEPLDLPELPRAFVAAAPVTDRGPQPTQLVLARAEEPFEVEERLLLVGTGRLLGQALQSARALSDEREHRRRSEALATEREQLLGTLREREQLLSSLLDLQQAVARRRPVEEVLDLLAARARGVLEGDAVVVVLEDPLHPEALRVVARDDRPGALPCAAALAHARAALAPAGPGRGIHPGCVWHVAPVRAQGRVVGGVVLLDPTGRTEGREHLLGAFAEHASTALNDEYTSTSLRASYYDQLTRLPNRTLFLDRLAQGTGGTGGTGTQGTGAQSGDPGEGGLALLYVDLDGFKAINDRHGHQVGDLVLAAAAARLQTALRTQDTAARLGGDEFAVLLHDVTPEQAVAIARRLQDQLAEPVLHEGTALRVGASIGVAVVGHEGTTPASLVPDADAAMYTVKGAARGPEADGVGLFHAELHRARTARLRLEADLARAVETDEFVLHYQPVVDLEGRPLGCEALLRWQHPEDGLLYPDRFVGVAERSGAIARIGALVLRQACRQVARWRREGLTVDVAVNLSGAQLRPALLGEVRAALAEADLPATALTCEVTETVLVTEAHAIAVLADLRALGVRVAVDDFGTGYSSLAALRRLPVDVLKIDRSFVAALDQPGDAAIVEAVLRLAQALDLDVVAEGVETEFEARVLRELGCPTGQGYRWARPLPAEDFRAWWAARVGTGALV